MNEKIKPSVMAELLESHQELSDVPGIGETITGTIIEKTSSAIYLDLGQVGVGVIYGRELFDDLDTFQKAKIGDTVQANVLAHDNEDGYVELSLRTATVERTWEELRRRFSDGSAFPSEIIDANKGGLLVRVNGVSGFLPVSQLAPDHYPRVEGGDKNKILERLRSYMGQSFTVKIISLDQDDEKLIVSEKSAISDIIGTALEQLGEGKIIKGVVSGIVDFGVFVKFEEADQELEGLVHISELAWQRIDDPANLLSLGQEVKAKVIGIDDGLRISLSIKQLEEDPWVSVTKKYNVGDTVNGEVLKVTPFGGFVRLDQDIHGLIHVSELPESAQNDPTTLLKAGEKLDFTVISLEPKEHRLGLSLRATESDSEKEKDKKEEKPKKKVTTKKATKKKAEKTEE